MKDTTVLQYAVACYQLSFVRNIYQKIYSDKKNLGNLAENVRIQKMAAILNEMNPEHKNILDIGCYDGTLLTLIKNRNNNFYGLEASDWGVRRSREKEIEVRQYFFDGSGRLPYGDNFFGVVVAGEIIEHIFDTDYFIEEIHRILKPGGKLLLSTPNVASLGRRLMLLAGRNPILETSPNEPDSSGHIRYFTFESLKKLLEKNNLAAVEFRSDVVNFSADGKIKSRLLANIFPQLGASIICLAKANEK